MGLLPTEKTKKVNELSKQVILLYGRAKIGKSTFAANFDDALFLATEPGLNHLEVFKTNINSWDKFLSACGEIAKGEHGFKTVVVDTVDNLVGFCQDYVCRENKISHPSELPHGKGWSLVTVELSRALVKLASLPYGVVFISHSDLSEVETKTKKYSRYTISVGGKNKHVILNMVDIILFVDSAVKDGEEKRIIRTKPSLYWEAGDRSGELPEEVPLDFNEFKKYFKQEETKEVVESK